MAKNLLVINVDIRETRVALIENGIIAELHIERESSKGTLGNIYLGKVSRVLPGMQAAFIDVGLERAAFLHVEDLIRPDDFDAYLSGHRSGADDDDRGGQSGSGEQRAPAGYDARPTNPPAAPLPVWSAEDVDEAGPESPAPVPVWSAEDVDAGADDAEAAADDVDAGADNAESAADDVEASAERGEGEDGSTAESARSAAELQQTDESVVAAGEPLDAPVTAEGEASTAIAPATAVGLEEVPAAGLAAAGRTRSRRGRVRRSGRTSDREPRLAGGDGGPEGPPNPPGDSRTTEPRLTPPGGSRSREPRRSQGTAPAQQTPTRGRHGAERGGDRHGRSQQQRSAHEPPRVSKATPIRDVVREGQEVIVQISKEPIGTKGARVTSHISLPGRYVVYLPTVDHLGISKRIGSEKERVRLRDAIEAMKPPQGGLIVRTMAEGLTKKQLKTDIGYLVRLWGEIVNKRETARAPSCLYAELDLVLRTARDLFTDEIEKIIIDSPDEFGRLQHFVETFMPDRVGAVELYEGGEPIFDAFGIEDEIQRALARKVPLKSGGSLIVDQAEALTAIDVNTGRFVGKGSKDLEDTILTTNIEAVEEIAYQLRFRNLGGLIILDLIDMERAANREKVRRRLEELLTHDKAKTTLNRISDLGLIEMTRKRTRESLGRTVLEPCFYCDGTGQLQSKATIAYEILRQIRRERLNLPGYVITVNAHPAIVDLLKNDERVAVTEAERLFTRRIELVPRKEYHLEQFDLQGR